MNKTLLEKVQFVSELSETISKYQRNVEKVEYKVFDVNGGIEEFVVITYVGGAYSAIRSNWNSFSSIIRIISNYLDSGDYDHQHYLYCQENGQELN